LLVASTITRARASAAAASSGGTNRSGERDDGDRERQIDERRDERAEFVAPVMGRVDHDVGRFARHDRR
jgi:hypothetical protein